jgi:tRNA-modifying protein YgfZ
MGILLVRLARACKPAYVNLCRRATVDNAMPRIARLPERSIVAVTGVDAGKFLQDLVTADLGRLAGQRAVHAALLSPQGKMLFEFIIVTVDGGFRLETGRARAADLVKRLGLYKLRAAVQISDLGAEVDVYAAWGDDGEAIEGAYADPRLAGLGWRLARPCSAPVAGAEPPEAYHAHRIAQGVPEGGLDYQLGDTFPHEACLDLLGGVSFDKGCFIGQEVVSRMQHRGTARKRIVMVHAPSALPPPGTPIVAGETAIGSMGSSAGPEGLALVRLDRAADAIEAGTPIEAGPLRLTLGVPAWATYAIKPAVRA